MYYVTIVVKPGDDRDVTGVRIDNITDLEGGGKDDLSPAPHNEFDLGSTWDPGTRTYTANTWRPARRQRAGTGELQLRLETVRKRDGRLGGAAPSRGRQDH